MKLDETSEDALSLITAGCALLACLFLVGSIAVPFVFL
jgi:hypothetical protein